MSENKNINETEEKIIKLEKPIVEKTENENMTIGLDKVLNICTKYIEKEITQKELQEWVENNIKIQLYLPIETKFLLINNILYNEQFYSVDDSSLKSIELETKKFWVIALAYTNIKTDGYEDLESFSSYDIIFAVMGDWLLSNIKLDYDRTIDILQNTININNINGIMETFGNLDTQGLRKYTTEIKKQLKYLQDNKEQIKDLADILRFNQPSLDNKLKNK